MRKLSALVMIALLLAAPSGCSTIECGVGTTERNGSCEPADVQPDPTACGPFTEIGPSGMCEPIFDPAVCDPDTTFPIQDPETGVITCMGTGAGGCDSPLPNCDVASSGTMTVCGRIHDVQDDTRVGGTATDTSECPSGGEATGPCSLRVTPYDALAFAADPGGATPLNAADVYIDHCGRFRLRDIQPAGAPFIGLGVDDHPMQPNNHKNTGVALPTEATTARYVVAYTTRNATDALWTTGTGEPLSLTDNGGVYLNIYRNHGTSSDPIAGNPAPGVQVLRGGVAVPTDDFYFDDTTPSTRASIAPAQAVTGANGSVLVVRQPSLTMYGGTRGPLPPGCDWYTSIGGTIDEVVFVQIRPPSTPGCSF